MSVDERFTLLLLAVTSAIGLLGWFLRNLITSMRDETQANTAALAELTKEFERYRLQVAERAATDAQAEAAELRSLTRRRRRRFL